MNAVRHPRSLSAVALLALAGACADQPMPLAPSALGNSVNRISTAVAGEGELQLCKAGNAAGTFQFDYSVVERDGGAPVTSGSVAVDVGQCATLLQLPISGSSRYVVTITETALPTDWALSAISATNTTAIPAGWGTPVVDVNGRTVSNVGVANDVGATITFDNQYTPPPPPPAGCTYTLGYWKTHSEFGPAPYDATWAKLSNGASTTFYLSGSTWIGVFGVAPAGNAYYQLAHQYMAAKLNVLDGADPTVAAAAIASAETLFAAYTPAQVAALPKNSATRALFLALASTLDEYNNGIIGPGHCGT
jgi:hypothetical protein